MMTDYMFQTFMRRLRRRHTAKRLASWKANVEAASNKWDSNVSFVPLDVWR